MNLEEQVAALLDREAIRETIYRYAHAMDHGTREDFESVWAPDAVYKVDHPFPEVVGIDAIMEAWSSFQIMFPYMYHHTGNILIDGPHGDEARAKCYAFHVGCDSEGTPWTASCTYFDTFKKIDGRWLFTERYDKVHYMVPWHEPLGADMSKRMYLDPEGFQRLIEKGRAAAAG